jgi:hypothetical protein
MKVLRNIVTIISLLVVSQIASAGYLTGKVTSIRVDANGAGIVTFSTTANGQPSCVNLTAYNNAFAFNATTPGGRAALATLLFAHGKGSTVIAYGTNTCVTYGGASVEDFIMILEY